MNIHPLIVHFPIALLVVYSTLEIGAYFFSILRQQAWLFSVKTFLLLVGVLASFVALITGGIAEDIVETTNSRAFILNAHSPFAWATTVLYLAIAVAYLIRIFDEKGWGNSIIGTNALLVRIWSFKKYVAHLVLDTWLLPVLALLAFISMSITGALGAAIVYGPDADPFVSIVYHLFWAK